VGNGLDTAGLAVPGREAEGAENMNLHWTNVVKLRITIFNSNNLSLKA
jgi:hypothetical protein